MNKPRPKLREIPLSSVKLTEANVMTINVCAWDDIIKQAYIDGWILLEFDQRERPIRAFRRETKNEMQHM